MQIESENFVTKFQELKKKYGSTNEFKQFEKEHAEDIGWIKFKKKNRLRYSKKNGWNKQFSPIVESVWIKDKKNWNKGLRKFGYYQNVTSGWRLGGWVGSRCLWCGKLITVKKKQNSVLISNTGNYFLKSHSLEKNVMDLI